MRNICVVTGTRAEYGLLRSLIEKINKSPKLNLQLIVTGAHLSSEFGRTAKSIEDDGFNIDHKIEILLSSDTSVGITKSMGLGLIGFAEPLAKLKPDLIVILGDRYEIFAVAAAAMIARIPIAHLHGGERTEGVIDEAMRHSITKMSHLHFVANKEYKKRVIQLGEAPKNVFNVGGLGVDSIKYVKTLKLKELEKSMSFTFQKRNLLITFHPPTLNKKNGIFQLTELLNALNEFKHVGLIFTMPNADPENFILREKLLLFCSENNNAKVYTSLGQLRYFSCLKYIDGVVGNSSSGLLEVPSFKKGTVNIGDRQKGRLKALSVIDCNPIYNEIKKAITKMFSNKFKSKLHLTKNPYGKGGASKKILAQLEKVNLTNLLYKDFHDI